MPRSGGSNRRAWAIPEKSRGGEHMSRPREPMLMAWVFVQNQTMPSSMLPFTPTVPLCHNAQI